MALLTYQRRLTTPFMQAVPSNIVDFQAYLYAVVPRKPHKIHHGKWGIDVRLDPCILDWKRRIITIIIPTDINDGISSIDDLDPNFYEAIEASFLMLLNNCIT